LTEGSERECSDVEFVTDPWSDSDPYFSEPEDSKADARLYRDLAKGRNLNNSFGVYSVEDWDHLHVDKGANS